MQHRHDSLFRPPEIPQVQPGRIDFFRIHALALDWLGDLLAAVLPIGTETDDARWQGCHPDRPLLVTVSLLSGCWEECSTGRAGRDLVSLTAHLLGITQAAAARQLAEWLGAEVRRYG
jgi:hypothetical protein